MAALDEATVGRIKVDYEESSLTVGAIGIKFGVSASYISRLAREHGWLMRTQRMGRRPRTTAHLTIAGRAFIAHRLCGVINRKIDQMEKDMESGELSSADLERDAKTIASMVGGMQKVVPGPDEDKVSKPDAARSNSAADANEVERLQREIIERFVRIQRRREVERGSE
jgi:hypothetical protein